MRGALLAISILCALAGWGVDRFGHELCHRGVPLSVAMLAAPIAGSIASLASLRRGARAWMTALAMVALAVNAWYLWIAVAAMTGPGILSCG